MFRKTILGTALASLALAAAFILNRPVAAAPLAQATATPEHDMNMNVNSGDDDLGHEEGEEHMSGERLDAGGASIRIVSPNDGEAVSGPSLLVQVETAGFTLGESGHFHLYVDGKEQGMSQGGNPAVAANDLGPGEHAIEVVLSNALHQELNATHAITIHVEGESHAAAGEAAGDNSLVTVVGIVVAAVVVAGAGYLIARKP